MLNVVRELKQECVTKAFLERMDDSIEISFTS